MKLTASYYQQFDADLSLDVPGEGYGGWHRGEIEIAPEHTAVVVMHAWETGAAEQYPGWYRCVEYIPRAQAISRDIFPPLLDAVRASDLNLFHVVGGGDYYKDLPGYKRALELAGPTPSIERVASDPALDRLHEFKREHSYVGRHNEADVPRGFARIDFTPEARPFGDEGIAENAEQLFALCKTGGINHLIYMGFAIDWCLLDDAGRDGGYEPSRPHVLRHPRCCHRRREQRDRPRPALQTNRPLARRAEFRVCVRLEGFDRRAGIVILNLIQDPPTRAMKSLR